MLLKPWKIVIITVLAGFLWLTGSTLWEIRRKSIVDAEGIPRIARDIGRIADCLEGRCKSGR